MVPIMKRFMQFTGVVAVGEMGKVKFKKKPLNIIPIFLSCHLSIGGPGSITRATSHTFRMYALLTLQITIHESPR